MPRVWLITGASSGFGRALTEIVLSQGDVAVATLRTPSDLDDLIKTSDPARLLVLKCDVTIPQDIISAFAGAIEKFGRCDIVFNNAGYGIVSEVEGTPDQAARDLFEVNFWGSANVSREAVRVFREENPLGEGGRLIVTSSGAGFSGVPATGYYSASKHAIEGLTESLAKELDPTWNIKISIIGPGAFNTKSHGENAIVFPSIPAYSNPKLPGQAVRKTILGYIKGDANRAARRIFDFCGVDAPPMRIPLGKDAVFGTRMKLKAVNNALDEYESWSENLERNSVEVVG